MQFELLISLISLMLVVTLFIYVYRVSRKLGLLLQAVRGRTIAKMLATLKSGGRRRKRYMVFELVSSKEVSAGLLEYEVRSAFKKLFGEVHLARAALSIQYFNNQLNIGVIKYSHTYRYKVLAALGVTRRVGDAKVMVIPLRTTGSLRRALRYVKKMEVGVVR
ncbi:MAG: Rpp14/Pop5 family protein [Sulfolobales archaeon]